MRAGQRTLENAHVCCIANFCEQLRRATTARSALAAGQVNHVNCCCVAVVVVVVIAVDVVAKRLGCSLARAVACNVAPCQIAQHKWHSENGFVKCTQRGQNKQDGRTDRQ